MTLKSGCTISFFWFLSVMFRRRIWRNLRITSGCAGKGVDRGCTTYFASSLVSFLSNMIVSQISVIRSRIQQVTSSSNSIQRRSGNVLPPPGDEYCNNSSSSSGKPMVKTSINTNVRFCHYCLCLCRYICWFLSNMIHWSIFV